MRVLLVTQYFPPEIGATQNRMSAFADAIAAAGHELVVLTEVPNHPSGVVPSAYRGRWIFHERSADYAIMRVWVFTRPHKTFLTRVAFYGSFLLMAVIAALRSRVRFDVVAVTTPPLTAAAAALVISKMKRIPLVTDVRDLWPEAARALGELSNPALLWIASRVERAIYRSSAAVTATTPPFCAYVAEHGGPPGHIEHIPNGTMSDVFDTRGVDGAAFRRSNGVGDGFVIGYVGLHGIAQGLDIVLDAAARTPEATFVLVGEGPCKAALMAEASRRGCRNVHFVGEVPTTHAAAALAAMDALLVPLKPDPIFKTFVPSKLFDAMAASRCVVLMVDGEARQILDESGAGVYVPPGDAAALSAAVYRLAADPAARARMGDAGRAFVSARYDRRRQAERFAAIVADAGSVH